MKTKTRTQLSLVLLCASLPLGGCLLVGGVAAGAYASGQADKDRAAFHANNVEREKAGLEPLTREEWLAKKKSDESD
jgi:hypothetical protein